MHHFGLGTPRSLILCNFDQFWISVITSIRYKRRSFGEGGELHLSVTSLPPITRRHCRMACGENILIFPEYLLSCDVINEVLKPEGQNKSEDYLDKLVTIGIANFTSLCCKPPLPKLEVVVNIWPSAGDRFTNCQQMALEHVL